MDKIICIGEALIDMICTDKGMPLSRGVHFLKKAGGAPTNVAAAIAALGGDVQLLARVGADPFGHHLAETLSSFGVDISRLSFDEKHFTTLAFVSLMENGERDFYFNRGADAHLSTTNLQGLLLQAGQIVHFGSATAFLPGQLQHTYFELLRRACNAGCFISFDPNYRSLLFGHQQDVFMEQCAKFIPYVQLCKLSDEEALLLTQRDTLDEAIPVLRAMGKMVWCITLGGKGTLLLRGEEETVIPSIPVEVTDTTGAGDAFVGALLYQIWEKPAHERFHLTASSWEEMVAKANRAGARTCMYVGAMEAFRYLNATIFD